MNIQALEDAEYEFNARYDYVREAYGATMLDPYHEGYCNYVFECEELGEQVLDFDAWKAAQHTPAPKPRAWPDYGDDEIPF